MTELRAQLRKQLSLLAHQAPSEVVALDTTVKPARVTAAASLKGVEAITEWVEQLESISSTCSYFIGVADRRKDFESCIARRGRVADIAASSCVIFDVDPLRPSGTAADADGVVAAQDAATLLDREMVRRGFLAGHRAFSGNGVYLFYPGPRIEYADVPDFDRRVAALLESLRPVVEHLPVNLDHIQDWPRLIRIIGTQNRKGTDPELWRYSEWLE